MNNNEFIHNTAIDGGAMFANGGNIFATDTIFANNTAVNSGGSIFMNSSSLGLTLLDVDIRDNIALQGNGGGIYNVKTDWNTDSNPLLTSCMSFYNILFERNKAEESNGGAFYLNVVGEDEDEEESGNCLKVVNNTFIGNNDINGNEVYLDVSGGELAPFIREEWCSDDPDICKSFKTSLAYLCMQQGSIQDGICDILQKNLTDSELRIINDMTVTPSSYIAYKFHKYNKQELILPLHLRLIPGASVLFEIFGWDSFANRMFTNQFDIESNATAPVTFTSKASKLDKTAYVLPLFVDKGSVGQIGKGIIIDPSHVVDVLPTVIVEAVSCSDGYYQQELSHDPELFTCTECEYNTYSMSNTKCKKCKLGMICMGKNNTYVLSGYYGKINNDGSVSTQSCPKGYCCSSPEKHACLLDPYNKLNIQNPRLLCGNHTNRDWLTPLCGDCLNGYSETLSPIGECLICNDSDNFLYILLLPNVFGLCLIIFFIKIGLPNRDEKSLLINHPLIIYITKSLLSVCQLLPFLTFKLTHTIHISNIIEPVSQFFNLSINMFTGNLSLCILSNMNSRTKLSLNLLPVAFYGLQIFM
eukprot:455148_1